MVQSLLTPATRRRNKSRLELLLCVLALPTLLSAGPGSRGAKARTTTLPVLLLDGGRKLVFEGSLSSDKDIQPKHGFFKKVIDAVIGAPEVHAMVRPFSIVTDSRGRLIVTDPGAAGVHVFDVKEQKYKFISRKDKTKEPMTTPQCVAVDAQDRIYVTDSDLGKIFVFEPDGKFARVIGSLKRDEGYFKHPTGIAVDSEAQRIYVSDTWRDEIYVLDLQGNVLQRLGKSGSEDGQFNYPTDLRIAGNDLLVVDAMNFRTQILDRSGRFQRAIGGAGEAQGEMFRPKGLGIDSEGHLYIAEGASGLVQVFDRQGQLLYYFGKRGAGFGDFQLPTGLFVDRDDRVYVVDSFNRRVQIFQYFAQTKQAVGVQ